ncbi:MAG TPA: hypothetical protein VK894_02735 [Jiangellales bacterium]|nr:hypothetical protein [Jiangellales bacterium]
MPPRRPSRALAATVGACLVVLAGCADGEPTSADLPFSTGDPPQTFTAAPAPGDPAAEQPPAPVPESCGDLVSTTGVVQVLAVPLSGSGTFVYAGPIPESGRTARITCGYGVVTGPDGVPSPPAVEITLNGYVDEPTAVARLEASVETGRAQGDTVEAADLDGRPGYVLTGAEDASYLVGDGARTLVVTVRRGVVAPTAERLVLVDLAALALGLPVSGEATG